MLDQVLNGQESKRVTGKRRMVDVFWLPFLHLLLTPPLPSPELSVSISKCECAQLCPALFVTLWVVACQVPLSRGFSRQEYWSGLPWSPSRGSSRPRDQTHVYYVSCIGSRVLYHLVPPRKPLPLLNFMVMTPAFCSTLSPMQLPLSEALRMTKINFQSFLQMVREKLRFNGDYWLFHFETKTLDFRNNGTWCNIWISCFCHLLFL